MRNIPIFTTELGVASLSLQEIPYKKSAYITIQDSQDPAAFLAECASFCKAAGAESVYATGNAIVEQYPLYTAVWQMQADAEYLPTTDACLFPVTEETVEKWRSIYNQKMEHVANASYMTTSQGREMCKSGAGYFIHRDGVLLGIGSLERDKILSVASVVPGAGKDVVLALCSAMYCDSIGLEVASVNEKALKLYQSLGFIQTKELIRWYKII